MIIIEYNQIVYPNVDSIASLAKTMGKCASPLLEFCPRNIWGPPKSAPLVDCTPNAPWLKSQSHHCSYCSVVDIVIGNKLYFRVGE